MGKKTKKECSCEIAAKKKQKLKRMKKAENDKRGKKEMWARLNEFNNNFAKMKEQKKT